MPHNWIKDKRFKPEKVVKNKAVCSRCGCILYKVVFRHFEKQIESHIYVVEGEIITPQPKCVGEQSKLF